MSWSARLWERLLGPVLDFAGRCIARDDEGADDGSRGDCFLAQQLRRHAAGPHPDHCESHFHARFNATGGQQ